MFKFSSLPAQSEVAFGRQGGYLSFPGTFYWQGESGFGT